MISKSDADAIARAGQLVVTPASRIEPENIRWCWREWVPLGGLTVVAGPPGLGKSTLALHLAARVSRGWLAGDLYVPSPVLVVTLEDHHASVVRPRLQATRADLAVVGLVSATHEDRPITFPDDVGAIEHYVERDGVKLLVIDPVVATLSGDLDSHRDHHVRRVLAPLAQLAERRDLAVVAVMHFSKRRTADLLSRLGGSVGFGGAARSVIAFVREPDDEAEERPERVIVHAKANWGRKAESLSARIETAVIFHRDEKIETSRLRMLGPSAITSADLATDSTERGDIDDAVEFLLDVLADGEWQECKQIEAESKRRGVARRTLYRAAAKLQKERRLERQRIGFPAVSHWRIAVVPGPVVPSGSEDGGTTGESPVTTGDLGTSSRSVVPENVPGTTDGVGTADNGYQERAERLFERWAHGALEDENDDGRDAAGGENG